MNNERFAMLRDATESPFLALYYEILSRFHPHDYDLALSVMSDDLKPIIIACTELLAETKKDSK